MSIKRARPDWGQDHGGLEPASLDEPALSSSETPCRPDRSGAGMVVAESLRELQVKIHRALDRLLATIGTSYAQTRLLSHIENDGLTRSVDLATAMKFAPRTITEALDGLERDGLIRREADAADRRVKRISLTAQGASVAQSGRTLITTFLTSTFDILSQAERDSLAGIIEKLSGQLP